MMTKNEAQDLGARLSYLMDGELGEWAVTMRGPFPYFTLSDGGVAAIVEKIIALEDEITDLWGRS